MVSTQPPAAARRDSLHTLDTLAQRTPEELDSLYRAASIPDTMHSADGDLVGRLLAVRGIPPAFASPLRRWAASPTFLWEGKTFSASSDTRGIGINRVHIPGLFGRQKLFPFDTSFAPSAIDGRSALVIDYDIPVNPGYIRRIHDEIREVAPGLFLGPGMWKGRKRKKLVLWFALDSRLS